MTQLVDVKNRTFTELLKRQAVALFFENCFNQSEADGERIADVEDKIFGVTIGKYDYDVHILVDDHIHAMYVYPWIGEVRETHEMLIWDLHEDKVTSDKDMEPTDELLAYLITYSEFESKF